ncbi:MAG: YifB family Mg chelatase-like AAA ATPase [Aggregatilineales bacterium]
MLAISHACAVIGIEGILVEVQVDFNPKAGIPSFSIVGLPDSAVRESRERVRAAIRNSGLRFPNKGYVVNLSPADLPKHSTAYDLAIAIGVLAATDQIPLHTLEKTLYIGELSLDGRIRHVKGTMAMAYAAKEQGFKAMYVASEDAAQASLIDGITVYSVETLGQLNEHLYQLNEIPPFDRTTITINTQRQNQNYTDFADVKGQQHVKRALEVAAAGGHNVRLVGPPGTGKSLLSHALRSILPTMTTEEALEVTRIYSVADMLLADEPFIQTRPFQNPHHTASSAGLIGGGTIPKPGSASLSHRGILFLDEANEFPSRILESLRQPIEDKQITISRAKQTLTFPANFMLVLAHNPCPCGFYGDLNKACSCTPNQIKRYQSKLSGPLLDRIDIHVEVPRVEYSELMEEARAEASEIVQKRVERARQKQNERYRKLNNIFANGDLGAGEIQDYCVLTEESKQLLTLSVRRLQLSARSYHRVLKLSRTIADLSESNMIEVPHLAEALQYRPKDQSQDGYR